MLVLSSGNEDLSHWAAILDGNVVGLAFVVALLLAISFILSYGLQKLELAFHKAPHLLALLFGFYKELMILGIISFILFIISTFGVFDRISKLDDLLETDEDADFQSLIHVVHICLFITMLVYIALVLFLYFLMARTRRYWKQTEKIPADELQVRLEEIRKRRKSGCTARLNPLLFYQYYSTLGHHTYHRLRSSFIYHEKLRENFRFDHYITRCSRRGLVLIIEIHWSVWFVLLGFVIANFVRLKFIRGEQSNPGKGFVPFFIVGWVAALFAFVVHLKCIFIARNLSRVELGEEDSEREEEQAGIELRVGIDSNNSNNNNNNNNSNMLKDSKVESVDAFKAKPFSSTVSNSQLSKRLTDSDRMMNDIELDIPDVLDHRSSLRKELGISSGSNTECNRDGNKTGQKTENNQPCHEACNANNSSNCSNNSINTRQRQVGFRASVAQGHAHHHKHNNFNHNFNNNNRNNKDINMDDITDSDSSESDEENSDAKKFQYVTGRRHVTRCGGCCGCCRSYSNSKFLGLFWFRSPNFLLHCIQLILLSQALYFTFYFMVFLGKGYDEWGPLSIPLSILPFLITFFIFLPNALPTYTLVRYIDSTSTQDVIDTLRAEHNKQKAAYKKKLQEYKKLIRKGKLYLGMAYLDAIAQAKKDAKRKLGLQRAHTSIDLKTWKRKQKEEQLLMEDSSSSSNNEDESESGMLVLADDTQVSEYLSPQPPESVLFSNPSLHADDNDNSESNHDSSNSSSSSSHKEDLNSTELQHETTEDNNTNGTGDVMRTSTDPQVEPEDTA